MRPSNLVHIVAHFVGWLLFFGLILSFTHTFSRGSGFARQLLSPPFLFFCCFYLFFFYFNSYLLTPALYFKKRHLAYFALVTALLVIVYFIRPFEQLIASSHPGPDGLRPPPGPGFRKPPRKPPPIDITGIVLFVMIWSFGFALQIIKQWRHTERRAAQAEAEKAHAELWFLKAQINPHFLFNTLNNIYALAVNKSDAAPAAILKLSQIMRYITDEATRQDVPLEKEVQCITHYIDLQRLRVNDKQLIDFKVEGPLQNRRIAPLILMTFIENVFKYGISSHEPSTITIHLIVEANTLGFFCRNRIFNADGRAGRTGIGIENTQKRLQHLYPGRHHLEIQQEEGWFTVKLNLHLK